MGNVKNVTEKMITSSMLKKIFVHKMILKGITKMKNQALIKNALHIVKDVKTVILVKIVEISIG
jgi:hypothetical protein